jgi:hypothetical protein
VTTLYEWELVHPQHYAQVVVDRFSPIHTPAAYVAAPTVTTDPYILEDFGNALLKAAATMRASRN